MDAVDSGVGQVPIIDIGPLIKGELCQTTAKALRRASQNPGFIYVCNHGIANSVIDDARFSALEFFSLPKAIKSEVSVSAHHRGWLAAGGARMADDVPADLKESFIWGRWDERGASVPDHSLRGPNQWPDQHLPDLRARANDWFESASQLARCLLRGLALSLHLDPDIFLLSSDRPLSRASFVYYPPQKTVAGAQQFGVGPHTDFGLLTVLSQDEVGGLHVKNVDGQWIHAHPIKDTLIVNIGDLLTRWTHGEFHSAPHRVINTSDQNRLSLVLAYDPNPETNIDAKTLFPEASDCAEPITCGEYLDWRFSKAFAYRR